MRGIFNTIVRQYLEFRYRRIEDFINEPIRAQEIVFRDLIGQGKQTIYGKKHKMGEISSEKEFTRRVPVTDYEKLLPYIKRMMLGERDVLWPDQVKWFAKSSGTTSERSKYIPVSKVNLKHCHIKGSWDAVAMLYNNIPTARIFADKSLIMGGSLEDYSPHPDTKIGDVSAIMLKNMPLIGRPFFCPNMETALLDDWEIKIDRMARESMNENITTFGGVPTWTIVLFRRILEMTGKGNMLEVWPNAQLYMHGGVSFEPYRDQFKKFFPSEKFLYQEVYNASEGFFAVQDDLNTRDMLLLLDNGIYYEFIPEDQTDLENPETVPLEGVEKDKSYALIVSTNSGLWRYTPGDLLTFTSTYPFKIKIKGRTNQYINVFGEEVMIANTDRALSDTCRQFAVSMRDYSVAPQFIESGKKGGHQWFIEFDEEPEDIDYFADTLDRNLRKINSDYDAKRSYDLALHRLEIVSLSKGFFDAWMKKRGKLGGQNKVPRLCNDRKYADQIEEMLQDWKQHV
jgi:hypothetical protein